MKNIIFILSLISLFFISNDVVAQKRAYDIAINAEQDPDSTYIMLSETAPIKYRGGRFKSTNYDDWLETIKDSIRAEISDSIAASGGGLPYLVYTALLTETAPATVTNGDLIIGETYTMTDYITGDDFANVADVTSGVINTDGCVFIATGTTPTDWTNSSTLDSEGNPIPTVLQNTIGDIVWSYSGVGQYNGTLIGAFTNKTFIIGQVNGDNFNSGEGLIFNGGYSDDTVYMYSRKGDETEVNGFIDNYIEIRVYQP